MKWEIEIGKGIFFDINCLQCGINVFSDNYRYSFLLAFTAKRKWQKKKEVTQSAYLLIARIFLRLYGEKRNSQNIHRITCLTIKWGIYIANKSIEKRICKGDQKSQHTRLKTWEEYLYLVLKVVGVTRRDYTRHDYIRFDYTRRDYTRRDALM